VQAGSPERHSALFPARRRGGRRARRPGRAQDLYARQRIYKAGDPGGRAYVVVSGAVRVTTVDEDGQEVVVDQPTSGEFCGFASMFEDTPHQTNAFALEETVCVEVDRHDIAVLIERKPHAGMDLLAMLARQFHAAQQLVCLRAMRDPNIVIEQHTTLGERLPMPSRASAAPGGSSVPSAWS